VWYSKKQHENSPQFSCLFNSLPKNLNQGCNHEFKTFFFFFFLINFISTLADQHKKQKQQQQKILLTMKNTYKTMLQYDIYLLLTWL